MLSESSAKIIPFGNSRPKVRELADKFDKERQMKMIAIDGTGETGMGRRPDANSRELGHHVH
jgi:hypothetical protein